SFLCSLCFCGEFFFLVVSALPAADGGNLGVDGSESLHQFVSAFKLGTRGRCLRRLGEGRKIWDGRLFPARRQCLKQLVGLAQHFHFLPLLLSRRLLKIVQ